jgi:hypothetical protein
MTDRRDAAGRLRSFAETQFGGRLAALLLSGYDERQVVLRRRYAVRYRGGEDPGRRVYVEVMTDDPAGLPAREEPLVLLALLRLRFLSHSSPSERVPYSLREMIKTLGWVGGGGRAAVEMAVGRHYDLSFISHETAEAAAGDESRDHKRMLRPIIEWEREEETTAGDRLVVPKDGRVRFNPEFIEQLRERSLLGIDWDEVNTLTPVPS